MQVLSRFTPRARSRVRVAQICGAVDGAKWMVDLSASLQEHGYDVVAVIGSTTGSTAAALREAGVPFVAMPQHLMGWRRPAAVVRMLRIPGVSPILRNFLRVLAVAVHALRMAVFLRRHRIDIAHAQIYQSIVIGRLAAWLARVPIRVSMIPGPFHMEVPNMRRVSMATQWIDTVTVAGSGRVDELNAEAGIPASRRRVIRYGADSTLFDPARVDPGRLRRDIGVDPDTPLVGQVAYFYPPPPHWSAPPLVDGRGIKGHEDFIAAAAVVHAQRPEVRFVLVGGGFGPLGEEYRQSMMRLARELGVGDVVIFAGHRNDIPDAVAALDVSVQCSLSENYGGTIESLIMGRAVIATRVGGMPEAVRHEETGLLVPPRDPDALAAAMVRLLDDPDLRARLGAAGRESMLAGFTTQGMCEGVRALYEELLRAKLPWKTIPRAPA